MSATMRGGVLTVLLLLVPFATAHAEPATRFGVSVVIPALDDDERIVAFRIEVKGAELKALPNIPAGWTLSVRNEASSTSAISASIIVGAAALDASSLRDFLVVETSAQREPKLSLRGEMTVQRYYDGPPRKRKLQLSDPQFEVREIR